MDVKLVTKLVASGLICMGSALSAGEQELPQKFKITCNWKERVDAEVAPVNNDAEVLAYSSSSIPELIETEFPGAMIQTRGAGESRHFLLSGLDRVFSGFHLVIFPDGRSVATQIFDFSGDLNVSSTVGNCEVYEE